MCSGESRELESDRYLRQAGAISLTSKSMKRERQRERDLGRAEPLDSETAQQASEDSQLDSALEGVVRRDIDRATSQASLTLRQRKVWEMHLNGESNVRIAECLGVCEGTVRGDLRRAKATVMSRMERDPYFGLTDVLYGLFRRRNYGIRPRTPDRSQPKYVRVNKPENRPAWLADVWPVG